MIKLSQSGNFSEVICYTLVNDLFHFDGNTNSLQNNNRQLSSGLCQVIPPKIDFTEMICNLQHSRSIDNSHLWQHLIPVQTHTIEACRTQVHFGQNVRL